MFELSLPKLLIVLAVLLLIFGPSKLGTLGTSLGKAIREFRKSMRELDDTNITPSEEATRIENTRLETKDKTVEKEETK